MAQTATAAPRPSIASALAGFEQHRAALAPAAPSRSANIRLVFDDNRGYTPKLSVDLMRGDIVIARLVDLLMPERKQDAKRPCVIIDMFRDWETGEVAGLEMLACTRGCAKDFRHKMELPSIFDNKRWDGTHLILEKPVRLPLTSEHFYEQVKRVGILNPFLLQKALERAEELAAAGEIQESYGLATRPDHWQRMDIGQRDVTPDSARYGQSVMDHAHIERPLQSVRPGTIIWRRSLNAGTGPQNYPALVWGVWRHDSSHRIMAVETARITTDLRKPKEPWHHDIAPGQLPGFDNGLRIEMQSIDMVPNETFFFDPDVVAQPIASLSDQEMTILTGRRENALRSCARRLGRAPGFLAFNWKRVAGPTFELGHKKLAGAWFAPDLKLHRQPGATSLQRMQKIHLEKLTPG